MPFTCLIMVWNLIPKMCDFNLLCDCKPGSGSGSAWIRFDMVSWILSVTSVNPKHCVEYYFYVWCSWEYPRIFQWFSLFRRHLAIASTCGEAARRLWHSPSFTTLSKSFFIQRAFNCLVSFFPVYNFEISWTQSSTLLARCRLSHHCRSTLDIFIIILKKFVFIHLFSKF